MGNHRFRLSDMMPNAWFYKLKDMSRIRNQSRTRKKHQPPISSSSTTTSSSSIAQQRKSYYFTRELHENPSPPTHHHQHESTTAFHQKVSDPPRRSASKRRSTTAAKRNNQAPPPRLVTSSVSAGCSCGATIDSVCTKPDSKSEDYSNSPLERSSEPESLLPEPGSDLESFDGMVAYSASCRCGFKNEIFIEMDDKPIISEKPEKFYGFDSVSEVELPPIITKPNDVKKKERSEQSRYTKSSASFEERNQRESLSVKVVKEEIAAISSSKENRASPVKRFSVNSPASGVKLRTNSPRIVSKRIQGRKSVSSSSSSISSQRKRRSLSESMAVVKSSKDPQRDFRESMVEMIVENNIRASKDLEDLLACYLSLNSDEYHDLIIKVFKQIWFDIPDIQLK